MHVNYGRYQFLRTWNPLDWSYGVHHWSGALGAAADDSQVQTERDGRRGMKFRKRPVVIDAEQLTEERAMSFLRNKTPLPPGAEFARASYHDKDNRLDYFHCVIRTLEGTMRAEIGDWIIRGVKGEYYPCKPDIFAATYDPAPEGEQGR